MHDIALPYDVTDSENLNAEAVELEARFRRTQKSRRVRSGQFLRSSSLLGPAGQRYGHSLQLARKHSASEPSRCYRLQVPFPRAVQFLSLQRLDLLTERGSESYG